MENIYFATEIPQQIEKIVKSNLVSYGIPGDKIDEITKNICEDLRACMTKKTQDTVFFDLKII